MLYEETVEPATLGLLKNLTTLPELKGFRLVGGTALSLLFGHRKSIDLDLFTDQPLESNKLQEVLEDSFGNFELRNGRRHIFQCIVKNVKVDLVSVRDPFTNPVNLID